MAHSRERGYNPPMTQRSSSLIALEILHKLLVERTVTQAELASHVKVRSDTIRKHLLELGAAGVPLTREEEGRHVLWSIPGSWVPGGVFISHDDALEVTRLLARTPGSRTRDQLLKRLAAVVDPQRAERLVFVKTPTFDDRWAPTIHKALIDRRALHIRYFTMSRGDLGERHVSVASEVPPQRIVARCHRSDTLKWFRVDNVFEARIDHDEPYRETAQDELDAFIAASVDGFNANEALAKHSFRVRSPESRWVEKNLPPADITTERPADHPDELRVVVTSAAVAPIARYVLSLGGAARAETEPLRSLVHALAREALVQSAPG